MSYSNDYSNSIRWNVKDLRRILNGIQNIVGTFEIDVNKKTTFNFQINSSTR